MVFLVAKMNGGTIFRRNKRTRSRKRQRMVKVIENGLSDEDSQHSDITLPSEECDKFFK